MHFSKLIFFSLAIGLQVVPALCGSGGKYHLARRWLDQELQDLQATIRSLDEEWNFERRDAELELYSLEPLEGAFNARGLPVKGTSRSPSKGSSTSSGSKGNGHASHLIKPKQCSLKDGGSKKPKRELLKRELLKRELLKRASINVEAGHVEAGTSSDQLQTWSLKTCIGMAATKGGAKVLAHINGVNEHGESYETQLQSFEQKVQGLGENPILTVSYPNLEEGGAHLKDTLGEMIMKIEAVAEKLHKKYKAVDRPLGTSGEMVIRPDGTVETC